MASETSARLAVLIDAENASPALMAGLLGEVAKQGTVRVKRAYGDWTGGRLTGWKEQLLTCSILPIQQYACAAGKSTSDSAMIIDAMDLLYTGLFDGFCIASSANDFTRLAQRLRESGMTVYGFGERGTPATFVAACDKFSYLENLIVPVAAEQTGTGLGPAPSTTPAELRRDTALVTLLHNAVAASSDGDGWAHLASVGNIVTRQRPDFDARNYGYAKLSDVMAAIAEFELVPRRPHDGKAAVMYVRDKNHHKGPEHSQ